MQRPQSDAATQLTNSFLTGYSRTTPGQRKSRGIIEIRAPGGFEGFSFRSVLLDAPDPPLTDPVQVALVPLDGHTADPARAPAAPGHQDLIAAVQS